MILLSIRDIVEGFAQEYGLNFWDWIAFSITFTTLVISSVSLMVACKTLKSQKKTEENTTPDINIEIQLSLLYSFIDKYQNSVNAFYAFFYALVKTEYKTKPSPRFWSKFIDPSDYLFERVFYSNASKFSEFKVFIYHCMAFKNGIDRLKLLFEKNASVEEIKEEIGAVHECALYIPGLIIPLLKDTFGLSEVYCIEQIIENNYFPIVKDLATELVLNIKYLSPIKLEEFDLEKELEFEQKEIYNTLNEVFKSLAHEYCISILNDFSLCPLILDNGDNNPEYDILYEKILNRIIVYLMRGIELELLGIEYRNEPFLLYVFPESEMATFIKSNNSHYSYSYSLIDTK